MSSEDDSKTGGLKLVLKLNKESATSGAETAKRTISSPASTFPSPSKIIIRPPSRERSSGDLADVEMRDRTPEDGHQQQVQASPIPASPDGTAQVSKQPPSPISSGIGSLKIKISTKKLTKDPSASSPITSPSQLSPQVPSSPSQTISSPPGQKRTREKQVGSGETAENGAEGSAPKRPRLVITAPASNGKASTGKTATGKTATGKASTGTKRKGASSATSSSSSTPSQDLFDKTASSAYSLFSSSESSMETNNFSNDILKKPYLPLVKVLNSVLNQIVKRDEKNLFSEGISATEHPTFAQSVKIHMDIPTMRKKIREGQYNTLDTFQGDFYVTFQNILAFFPPESQHYQEAKRLLAVGREIIANSISKIDPSKRTATAKTNPPTPEQSATPVPPKPPAAPAPSKAVATSPKPKAQSTTSRGMSPSSQATSPSPKSAQTPPPQPKKESTPVAIPKTLGTLSKEDITPGQYTTFIPTQRGNSYLAQIDKSCSYYRNYVNNYLSFQYPSLAWLSTRETESRPDLNEHFYTSSLENFVRTMDNSALESINKFVENLRESGHYQTELPIKIGEDVMHELVAINQPEIENQFLSTEALDNIKELAQEGSELSFLEKVVGGTISDDLNDYDKKIQEQLDRNFELLYFLQLYQFERGKGALSESEKNIAAQLSKSLTDLSSVVPPSCLAAKNDNYPLLEQIVGFIESRSTSKT